MTVKKVMMGRRVDGTVVMMVTAIPGNDAAPTTPLNRIPRCKASGTQHLEPAVGVIVDF